VLHTGPCAQVSDEMLIMLTSAPTPPQMSTDSDRIPFGEWNNQHVQRAMVIRALVSQLRAAEMGIAPVEESDLRRRAEEDLDKMVQEQDLTTLNLLLTIGYKLAENAAQNLASGGGHTASNPHAYPGPDMPSYAGMLRGRPGRPRKQPPDGTCVCGRCCYWEDCDSPWTTRPRLFVDGRLRPPSPRQQPSWPTVMVSWDVMQHGQKNFRVGTHVCTLCLWEIDIERARSEFRNTCPEYIRLRDQLDKIKGDLDAARRDLEETTGALGAARGDLTFSNQKVARLAETLASTRTEYVQQRTDRVHNSRETPSLGGGTSLEVSKTECVVCLSAEPVMALMPCGHRCACEGCGPSLRMCPMCRADVQEAKRIFD